MTPSRFLRFASVAVLAALCLPLRAETHLRWNQQGYAPAQRKVVLVMSDQDLAGRPWSLQRAGEAIGEGPLGESISGAGDHSPFAFHHRIDLSDLAIPGEYRLAVPGAEPATIRVWAQPYADLANLPLQHLRMARSGTDTVLWRRASHFGDAAAPMHVPRGDPAEGAWSAAADGRTVDVLGGWYDAGDCLKFTLTTAYTVYHLLLAYEVAPDAFQRIHSTTALPDLLDEAKWGLDYLAKLMPDDATFIIQVGDARDHNQGWRLPADDQLDGQRPALAAPSRVHLYAAAAALARGARTFAAVPGQAPAAVRYRERAEAMFRRAQESDTLPTAFERDEVNDFYRDNEPDDQACLAAVELAALTGDLSILNQARRWRPAEARRVSWATWNWLPLVRLAERGDATARTTLRAATAGFAAHGQLEGQPWGLPAGYTWGSMMRWISMANAAQVAHARIEGEPGMTPVFADILDYTFGRNPWGVSFLFDERLPNTVRHLYSPTADLLNRFPTGALAEGPSRQRTHEAMRDYFSAPADDPLARFNTGVMAFHDSGRDFICQEATIAGQADAVLLLALAAAATE